MNIQNKGECEMNKKIKKLRKEIWKLMRLKIPTIFESSVDEEEELEAEMEHIHMGLFNLRLRLYFLYGEQAYFTICSKRGEGTKVTVGVRKNYKNSYNIKKV